MSYRKLDGDNKSSYEDVVAQLLETEAREEHLYSDIRPGAPSMPDLSRPTDDGWGEPFKLTLTGEWQEVTPGVQVKLSSGGVFHYRQWNSETGQWGNSYGAMIPINWWEFAPSVHLRKSPDDPSGKTEFRHRLAG